jgi:hypothetical protein
MHGTLTILTISKIGHFAKGKKKEITTDLTDKYGRKKEMEKNLPPTSPTTRKGAKSEAGQSIGVYFQLDAISG